MLGMLIFLMMIFRLSLSLNTVLSRQKLDVLHADTERVWGPGGETRTSVSIFLTCRYLAAVAARRGSWRGRGRRSGADSPANGQTHLRPVLIILTKERPVFTCTDRGTRGS